MSEHTSPAAAPSGTPNGAPASAPLTLRQGLNGTPVGDTVWAQIGGTETFERIVRAFYARVREDELLAPMYPESDWEGAIWRLRSFLEQYWGGPMTYSEQRGHPRLRMRHAAFPITPEAKDRWLTHMHAALDDAALAPMQDAAFREYIERAALSLVNRFE